MVDVSQIAGAAKNFACTLYKNQPGALIPNPISDALRLVWDNFCSYPNAPGLPAKPTPPFTGGQCLCVIYVVTVRIGYSPNQVDASYIEYIDVDIVVSGVVRGLRSVELGNLGSSLPYQRVDVIASVGMQSGVCNQNIAYADAYRAQRVRSFVITRIVRQDGGIDNCGNLPDKYPDSPPPPPEGYTSPAVNFTFNDGGNISFNFNLKPPLPPLSPVLNLPPVIINLVKPTANFNIPIAFNFDGAVNFGGSAGRGDNTFNQDDRDSINNIKNTTNNTNNTINNTNNNVSNFYSDFIKERDKDNNKPPLPTDFDPPKPAVLPGSHSQERLAFVNVNLTVLPKNAKSQSGDGSPDVIYAGWFEFTRGGKNLPREPIHFVNNCFVAPIGVDGYAFTLYTGYEGEATAVVNKE